MHNIKERYRHEVGIGAQRYTELIHIGGLVIESLIRSNLGIVSYPLTIVTLDTIRHDGRGAEQ